MLKKQKHPKFCYHFNEDHMLIIGDRHLLWITASKNGGFVFPESIEPMAIELVHHFEKGFFADMKNELGEFELVDYDTISDNEFSELVGKEAIAYLEKINTYAEITFQQ